MNARFRLSFALLAAAAALLAAEPALSQSKNWVEPPKDLPRAQRGDRTKNLDFLFEALKIAPDATSAKHIEDRIWALWVSAGGDTATELMRRVKVATESQSVDLALQLLDKIVEIKPDYVEGWNRRATLHYMKKDYSRSLADLRQVLVREPRHFGAMAGLGLIMQELGDDKRALDVYRRLIAIHPHMPRIPDLVKTLKEKVEGRDI
jgi:tetratricopeptide (TPR) repeat protein